MIPLLVALARTGPPECPARFTDVAAAARLAFVHERGATPEHRMAETMGSGVAWLDYDGDGSVRTLTIHWPSGKVQVVRDLPAGKYATIAEK